MLVEAFLGEEDGGHQNCQNLAKGQQPCAVVDGVSGGETRCDQDKEADHAKELSPLGRETLPVERRIQKTDQPADQNDRVGPAAPQEIRIADQGIDEECGEQEKKRIGK